MRTSWLALLLFASAAWAQDNLADRVLVVENTAESASVAVGDYYVAKRAIPSANVCKVRTSSPDILEFKEYDARVKEPVRKCLQAAGRDKILYIVFSYKTPFSLSALPRNFALDQFVADIWDEFLPERGAEQNEAQPYFGLAQSEGNVYQPYVPLSDYRGGSGAKHLYSVWRLDGATPELAKGLLDKALFAETYGLKGQGCFDRRYGNLANVSDYGYGAGDWDVHGAAEFARKAGFTIVEDDHDQEFGTAPAPLRCDSAALYAGWYSMEHYNDAFTWVPGAIGLHLDSESATHLRQGTSWVANAIQKGITVTSGAIDEPFLENIPHPDQLMLYLLQGAPVGDAMLRSTRLIKWRIVNVGDPLYRPFPHGIQNVRPPGPELFFVLSPPLTTVHANTSSILGVINAPSNTGLRVDITNTYDDIVKLPPFAIIPSGENHVTVPIAISGMRSEKPIEVKIRVHAGPLSGSNTLMVFPMVATVTLSKNKLKGGGQVEGTILLRAPAPAGGLTVPLRTDAAAALTLPPSVAIPAGQQQAKFPITAKAVKAETKATVQSMYDDAPIGAELIVTP